MRAALSVLVTVVSVTAGVGGRAVAAPGPDGGEIRGSTRQAVPDSYIVVLRKTLRATRATDTPGALARRYGGTVRRTYTSALHGFEAKMSESAARQLAKDPAVSYVERNQWMSVADAQEDPPWGLDRIDERGRSLDRRYYPAAAAGNVHAYVIDTGIRFGHETFGGRAVSGYDAYDHDDDAADCQGHGTHVAGTIGGREYGVAKQVQLVGVRVLGCDGRGSTATVIEGVNWVTAHAIKPAVANMSLGGPPASTLDDAVRASIASGITYGLAAGNGNVDGEPIPACLESPARLPEAITVAATTATDARTWFSNYGSCVDIFAPGEEIVSAGNDSDTAQATHDGTSMASPHVVGAAAAILSEHPDYTPRQVTDTLLAAATPDVVTNPGEGTPNRLLYTGGPARDFTLALGSPAATLLTGTEQTVRIGLAQVGEGRQRVRLALSGVPDGVTATFSSAAVDTWENRSAELTLKADAGATPGTAAITVTAAGSDVTRSATLGLTVVAPELAVSLSDTAGTARPGTSLVTTVRSKVVAGSFPILFMSVAGLPAGVRLGGGTGTSMWPGDTSQLWFVVGSDAEPGTYPVTVTTSNGPVKASATYTLTVTGEPGACGSYDTPGIEVLGDSTESATITVSGCGRNAGAESRVTVGAARPYPEATDEVAIDLIAPDGSVHPLKAARTHDDEPEYVDSYTVDLSGVAADGEWQLRVHNGAEFWLDTIQINDWTLAL